MMEDITLQSRMRDWKHESLCPGFRARQFEYNPHYPELMVCGTLRGEVVVVDHTKNKVLAADLAMTEDFHDSILGLCWLHRTDHNMFVTGTSKGILKLCKIWTSSSGSSSTTSSSSYSSNISNEAYSIRSSAYKKFEDLTSVHVNCSDDRLLVSGYSNNAEVYDLESKQIVRTYKDIHKDHINISRFANLSPHVFGTSSFDKTVKVWDLRDNSKKPIYTCRSDAGHVMLCFSPDDLYLLTSAIDNEVRQYLTVDGKLQANLKIPQTGHPENYTRAYYMNNGDHIISGSSEEQTIRIHCAHTGSLIHSAQMYPGRKHESLYIQSLRGDPHQRNSFSVLVNYRDGTHPLEIIKVDMNRNQIGDDISELTRCAVSPNLSKDLNNILDDRANCDLLLCPCTHFSTLSSSSNNMNENGNKSGQQQYENKMGDGNQILVNGAIISARCHVLAQLISDEKKRLTKNDISGGKENEESYTATDILKVIVPSDVAWDTVPKVIEYLYTDNIDLSNNLLSKYHPEYDVALELHGIINNEIKKDLRSSTEGNISTPTPTPTPTPTRQTAPTSRKRPKKHGISKTKFVALFNLNYIERLLISANILELPAFGELVEWWCAEVICIANVERIATLAHHVGAVQLLDSAICFMVEHLPVILNFNNVSSTVVDKDKAPYYFLRLPMLVRVRVAVIYSCSIRLLDRDACCDKVHTTDEGKSQSFEETKNTRKTTVQEFANDKSLLAVLYAIWPSFDENNATINVNDLDNRFVKLTKNGISTLKTACKYGSENLLSEKFLGTNSEMMNHEKKAQAITMLQEALIDANRWFQNCKKYQEAPSESKIHAYYKTKFEDSLQRFADQAVLRSAQHDQLETNRKVKDFPEEQGVIPSCTGHKTLIVKGNRMLALGGGNRYSYMSLGHILSYHITTGVWSKLPTSGSPPSRLLHHAAAVIDEADPTHVIILGGTRKRESNLYLLDSIRMRWSKLKSMDQKDDNGCNTINILGKAMSPRAGHTITSLTENISFLSSKQYSKKSTGREKFLVIFGGYSNEDSTFYNDIHVICALQTHFNSPSSHQNQKTLSDTYYTFSWRDNIIVTGSAPEPRLAHSCTTIRPMPYKINTFDTEIGSRLLIIFGGVGSSNIYCDVNVLDTSQLTRNNHHLRWMETNVQGEKPAPRYGHTAVALDQENVAIFGGIARTPMPFNEIFILNFVNVKIVDSSNHSAVCNFIWSKIDVSGGCPCPRFRHTAVLSRNDCNTNDQNSVVKILVFGGTTRMNNRPLKPLDPQSVDTNLHQLIIQRTNQIRNNDKNMEKQMYEKYTWVVDQVEWEEIQTRFLYLPTQMNRTPICQSSSFASDIASMLDACNENLIDFSDINLIPTLSIVVEDINDDGNNNKIKEETQQIAELVRAHRIILTARSKRFRAMLMSGMQESRLGRVVCDMSYNVLFELVQFLYSDTVSVKALNEPHLLMRLLVVAGEYTLEKLAKVCEGVLLRLLDPENAAEFLEFSTFYNCTVFRSGTLSFILRNFQSVEKTAGFKELSKELKKEVFDKRDAVNVYKYKEICVSPTATGKK